VSTATNSAEGTCLGTIEGTTRPGYTPAIVTPAAPCFTSGHATLQVSLGTVTINLEDAQIAGSYTTPAGVQNGLLRGFVSLANARLAVFPSNLPFVGGKTLAQLLTGGDTFCPGMGSDLDTGPDGSQGWYFYLNYTAAPVAYTPAPPPAPPAPPAGE
jgi:hypothetical protein